MYLVLSNYYKKKKFIHESNIDLKKLEKKIIHVKKKFIIDKLLYTI